MKKLIILTLAFLMLTGCTTVPTVEEYRTGNIQSAYSLPFELCSSEDGRYSLRKVEYGPGLEVHIDGEKHIFDYWKTPAYAEIYDDAEGNIYVCMGNGKGEYSEFHVLSFEDGEYVDNALDFSESAFRDKIFPHLKVNYDSKAGKLGISTDVPAYKDKNYAEFTLPYGEVPEECYYKVPDDGVVAVKGEDNTFTVTFPLMYKVKGTDGGLIAKSTGLYAETKVRYSNQHFVIGYRGDNGAVSDGYIHVYKAESH
ncbi:MAG: hypothetical protein IKV63_07140 [Clostridia bacterium]|nr:hypothetical protein [Clostridia bacterium]